MTISRTVRVNILQSLKAEGIDWSGRLNEVDFLSRIYDLNDMPSHDSRYPNARGDIWKHRINNPEDWPDDWIYDDERFNLLDSSDNEFLRFLCEMVHPVVRPNNTESQNLLQLFNQYLGPEGYQIIEKRTSFGNLRYVPQGILPQTVDALEQARDIAEKLNSDHMQREIVRMSSFIESDPDLAIGTAKEFIETICKTILNEQRVQFDKDDDLPRLVKLTMEVIKPFDTLPKDNKTEELIRKFLGVLYTLTHQIAALRNLHGTGHGKDKGASPLEPRHAALAVNSAATLGLFLYQSYERKK